MSKANGTKRAAAPRSLLGAILPMAFGMALLAFLVAIDRPEWFHIEPATATALAISHVGDDANRIRAD